MLARTQEQMRVVCVRRVCAWGLGLYVTGGERQAAAALCCNCLPCAIPSRQRGWDAPNAALVRRQWSSSCSRISTTRATSTSSRGLLRASSLHKGRAKKARHVAGSGNPRLPETVPVAAPFPLVPHTAHL